MWLLDVKRRTFENILSGNCIATLDSNALEWAALPKSDSSFAYAGQSGRYDAKGFCDLFNKLKGTTLPEGPLVNNNSPTLLSNNNGAAATGIAAPNNGTNFSDINCPPIKEEDLYRANFQITNAGCKITGPVQPITGASTNGSTVRSSKGTNNSVGFSVNAAGFGQCSSLRNPTNVGVFTSPFGWRNGRMHNGVDIAWDIGTPIYAASNGTVVFAGDAQGYGKRVIILSPENIVTTYSHLDVIKSKEGQQVTIGQQIGDMGNTGFSTGPHLHFEVKLGGEGSSYIDPETCLSFGVLQR
jgi:murein DD-endopeptidase MepM/ murein hydrolase activator NlpD